MKETYFVGIDFGHGETAAWVVPLAKDYKANVDDEKGEALMLNENNRVEDRVIASEVYFSSPDTYTLTETKGATLFNQMKSRVSKLKENKDKEEAFKNYIKRVVERLLELNDNILDKERPNFLLYMASPTQWEENEKKAYLQFFNEAISELNLRFESIIDESDAAFFSKMSEVSNINECTLVIDYGSSTIDNTVIKGGKKISDKDWSSSDLGAGNIEKNMLRHAKDKNYQVFTDNLNKANEIAHQHEQGDIESWLLKYCRQEKEERYSKTEDDYIVLRPLSQFVELADNEENVMFFIQGKLKEATKSYREAVKEDLLTLRQRIHRKNGNQDPDNIILSGGASIMGWVEDLVKEVFPNSKPIPDRNPAFVVAKGVALYAKAQQKAIDQLMSEIDEKCFNNMYKDAFAEANHQAMCQLSGAVVQDITNSAPITGESIRQRFCYFIQGLNPQNVAFSQMLQKNFNNALLFEIGKIIKTAIKQAFGINADVSDIKVDLPIKALQWDKKSISPGGGFYEEITYTIENYKTFSFNFEWDKTRDRSKATEIARKVQTYLNEIDFAHETIYPEEYLRDYGENLKQIAKAEAYKLFVDKQLFKTTFTA